MSRISATFEKLAQERRKALIPFFTAGDPSLHQCVPTMQAMVAGGADLIELGIPFSDPMADGPTIQRASERALKQGVSLSDVLDAVSRFRQSNVATPVVLMGYANPIERMGREIFAERCAEAGVDGVLVVDYPPDEARALGALLSPRNIDSIFLLSPTSTDERIKEIAAMSTGYIYYVSLRGVTGASNIDVEDVARQIARIKAVARVPVGVGFGIRDDATARALSAVADAIVVGSRIVEEIETSSESQAPAAVGALINRFRQAMDADR
ncbi:MAG: tryptophan synthase subunit alpha [Betaproteobacteria bacterium]|nr:tryptophan synthase subunit alpha [Betaproteobacteria bacterium]